MERDIRNQFLDGSRKYLYCYRVWLANGRPNQGQIYMDKLRSYSVYCQAVRRVKRNAKKHEAEAFLEAALQGDLNLLKEMKK